MFDEYIQTYEVQYPALMFSNGSGKLVEAVSCSTSNVKYLIFPDGTWSDNWTSGDLSKAVFWDDKTPPTAALTDPSSSLVLTAGETYRVKWTANDDYGIYRNDIYFSSDDGVSYTRLEMMGSTMRQYSWKVSDVNSDKCKIKVVVIDVGQNEIAVESPVFTIQGGNVGINKQIEAKNFKDAITLDAYVLHIPSISNGIATITSINGKELMWFKLSGKKSSYRIPHSISSGTHILTIFSPAMSVSKKICLLR